MTGTLDESERRSIGLGLQEAADRLAILGHVYDDRLRQLDVADDYIHLEATRKEIVGLLERVMDEVVERGTFESLLEHTNSRRSALRAEESVIQREAESRGKIQLAGSELRALQADVHRESTALDDAIVMLKMQIQEAKRDFKRKVPALAKECRWDMDKMAQQSARTEETLRLRIESLKCNLEEEKTSHDDVVSFFGQCFKAMEDIENESQGAHQDEMATMDAQIQALSDQTKVMKAKEEQLKIKLIEVMGKLADEKKKLEIKRQEELDAEKQKAVIKIQKWWRKARIMVAATSDVKKTSAKKSKKNSSKKKK